MMDYVPERHHNDRHADVSLTALMAGGDPNDVLPPPETAGYLHKSEQWLALGRSRGYGPPFVRIGRTVRYRRGDLIEWLRTRLHQSTAEYDTKGAGRPRTVRRCAHCDQPLPRHLRDAI
jgi:hypothetical protein